MRVLNQQAGLGIAILMLLPIASAPAQNPPAKIPPAVAEKSAPASSPAEQKLLLWQESLAGGIRQSLANQRPILVRFGGESCPWCRLLEKEIAKPEVQAELSRWTLVSLDVDDSAEEARRLSVGPIPALRALSPRGRLIASHEGYLPAGDLIGWLKKHHDSAKGQPDDVLLATGEPNAISVVRLIKLFEERNAADREAAVRRLLPYPGAARDAVLKTFREGNLSAKLTAMELLTEWKAPVSDLDPWRPETFTDERLAALETWSREFSEKTFVIKPKPLTESQVEEARGEIRRMLSAPSEEAAGIRERLARLGEPLLKEVAGQLQKAPTDQARERLLALRYRLVADDLLVLRLPGGLERLASTDVAVRQKAADELSKLADDADQRLLLELFSDADPLVREICLRGLRALGGKEATAALVNLLSDPEPNIRAAVLKQLAEEPSLELVPDVARYTQTETDADLLVHAIRFFRETENQNVLPHLLPLLEHSSWQVRAEATESIAKIASGDSDLRAKLAREDSATYKRLLKMLQDPDSFVVAKALEFVRLVDTESAVEPLVAVGEKHPSLIPHISQILGSNSNMREKALPHLREYFRREDPAVRAAAVKGLFLADRSLAEEILPVALADRASEVRIAAAGSILDLLESARPDPESFRQKLAEVPEVPEAPPRDDGVVGWVFRSFAGSPRPAHVPAVAEKPMTDKSFSVWDQWLLGMRRGEHRPKWMESAVPLLKKMLASEDAAERALAGLVLVPLGKSESTLPVMLQAAKEHRDAYGHAVQVLPWLPFPERKTIFRQLADIARNPSELEELATHLNVTPDQRSAELYWELLKRPDATPAFAASIRDQLLRVYYGERYWDQSSLSPNIRRRIAEGIKPHAQSGTTLSRLVAISFLVSNAPADAADVARGMLADESLDPILRTDAFQILLVAQPESDRRDTALEALRQQSADKRKVALAYLSIGSSSLGQLKGSGFAVDSYGTLLEAPASWNTTGKPIIPDPPKNLTLADVKPLIQDPDPEIAAYAGYLASLFGEKAGLPAVLGYWRSQTQPDSDWDRLVYRAIASLDDSEQIPILKEIYGRREVGNINVNDFYWTIRIMTGPEILEFRKQIRDEVGMQNLSGGGSTLF